MENVPLASIADKFRLEMSSESSGMVDISTSMTTDRFGETVDRITVQ
jgi:hypothetical protein